MSIQRKIVSLILLTALTGCAVRPNADLPPAVDYNTATTNQVTTTAPVVVPKPVNTNVNTNVNQPAPAPTIKAAVNLAVPFQSQAPFADWSEPFGEACEEATSIMVDHYLRGVPLSATQMRDEILASVDWQVKHFGGHIDLPIAKVAEMDRVFYPNYTFEIVPNLTFDTVKTYLNQGLAVIVPSAGRELHNPNFKTPGPIYHMLVIKGYTKEGKVITNDPGTRNGADYVYDQKVLFAAIRDWDGDSPDGPAVGLVLHKNQE